MPLYSYVCEDKHETEVFASYKDLATSITCSTCGKEAVRRIAPATVKLDPISGDFPGATDKWERDHIKAAQRG